MIIVVLALATSTILGAQTSETLVADFEQVLASEGEFVLPTRDRFEYAQLQWHGVYVVDSDDSLMDQIPASGYRTGSVSGRYVAVAGNRGITHSMIRPVEVRRFDLLSAHFTAAWRNGLQVRLEARREGRIVDSREIQVDTSQPQLVEINFTDVNDVLISARGGKDAGFADRQTAGAARRS